MSFFVFRNYTCESLFPKGYGFSGYGEFYEFPTDCNTLIWFYQCPVKPSKAEILTEIQEYKNRIEVVLVGKKDSTTFIYLTTEQVAPMPFNESHFEIRQALAELNQAVYEISLQDTSVKFLDFSVFLSVCEPTSVVDWKFYYYAQALLSPKLASTFQAWWAGKLNAIASKRKKCLILDLDNTLWHGILGEDGIFGIQCGKDYPGNAFHDFQECLLEAARQGVILAVCSKNNEEDVMELWQENSDVVLKGEALSAWRINWKNKAENIQEIAEELNIGLDSMVFLDDNPLEREMVRSLLPEVETPDFPEKPWQLPTFFQEIYNTFFRIYKVTDEDLYKTAQYKSNSQRNVLKRHFTNLDDYLANLEMVLTLRRADAQTIPRIAQMSQKTNQFNLTTRRYSEQDIHQLLEQDAAVWTLSVKDKFGDNGLTVLVILRLDRHNSRAEIDSFLLSCRILGRGIESAFLTWLENRLHLEGIRQISAQYIPTLKNAQTALFFENNGYEMTLQDEQGGKHYGKTLNTLSELKPYYHFFENEKNINQIAHVATEINHYPG